MLLEWAPSSNQIRTPISFQQFNNPLTKFLEAAPLISLSTRSSNLPSIVNSTIDYLLKQIKFL